MSDNTAEKRVKQVYFVGAAGTGKSTMVAALHERFGGEIVTGAARHVLRNTPSPFGLSGPIDMLCQPNRIDYMFTQVEIMDEQLRRERAAISKVARQEWKPEDRPGQVVWSDRCFDHLAYSLHWNFELACHLIAPADRLADYMKGLLRKDVAIFYTRPCVPLLVASRASRSPDLSQFLTDELIYSFDGTIRGILSMLRMQGQAQIYDVPVDRIETRVGMVEDKLGAIWNLKPDQ